MRRKFVKPWRKMWVPRLINVLVNFPNTTWPFLFFRRLLGIISSISIHLAETADPKILNLFLVFDQSIKKHSSGALIDNYKKIYLILVVYTLINQGTLLRSSNFFLWSISFQITFLLRSCSSHLFIRVQF